MHPIALTASIRRFEDHDYAQAVAVGRAVYPDYPWSEEEWRHWDTRYEGTDLRLGRLVAEEADTVIGVAEYRHERGMFHPQKFWVEVFVRPEAQGRGIGSALYRSLLEEIAPFQPIVLWTGVRETSEAGIRFAQARGFREVRRAFESRLDVAAFDPSPFLAKAEAAIRGLDVTTVAEVRERDPDWRRRVYELDIAVGADVPRPAAYTAPTLEDFIRSHEDNPDWIPEAHFLVRDGDRYVAESNLHRSQELPDVLYQSITGTLREHRGRGLALAVKLQVIDWARRHAFREIRTWNDSLNAPMLHINRKLGFLPQAAWITFERRLAE